jgi:DNA polymerase III, delta subunit
MRVETGRLLEVYRPRSFEGILGQSALVATLKGRITRGRRDVGHHLVLAGRAGAGKMTVARMYAQAILCEAKMENASPCQECNECKGVLVRSSFSYVELDAAALGDEEHIRYLVELRYGFKTADWRVVVVDNAELLDAPAADVMLKTLEKVASTIFIFVVNDTSAFPAALRSRCQLLRVRPSEPQPLVDRLAEICDGEAIPYERPALNVIVNLSGALVGSAFRKLAEVVGHRDVTVAGTLKALKLDWGETMLHCWRAQLDGRADEALSCFERVASDDEGRIRAMQSFLLTMHLRFSSESPRMVDVSVSPALDYLSDESWQPVILGWQALSRRRSVPVDGLVTDVMNFWGRVRVGSPSRSSFMKGYEVLVGMPQDFAGSAHEGGRWGAGVAR